MVRRVRIEILCSQCHRQSVEREGRTVQLVIDTTKLEVDLCRKCEDVLLQPLQGLATTRGGKGGKPSLAAVPASVTDPEQTPCFMLDGYQTESHATLAAHLKLHHNVGFGQIIDRCPLCATAFSGPSAIGMHVSRVHALPGIGAALWEAHLKGDPHGVVSEARKRIETQVYVPMALSGG